MAFSSDLTHGMSIAMIAIHLMSIGRTGQQLLADIIQRSHRHWRATPATR
jgi:hypothetical protein